jgi:hypothetical protein
MQQPPQSKPVGRESVRTQAATDEARLTSDFAPSTYQALLELAEGSSLPDALRDAIALSKWFKDTRETGARILVERNGKFREIVKI